jgi:hypothetical protein
MLDGLVLGDKFFETLLQLDQAIGAAVAAGGCRHCGGPLHRGDYPRKPRGGLIATAPESFSTRISFCCGQEGCRRRATPPSVRFLGRRVYLGGVVVIASLWARVVATAREVKRRTGIPPRTVARWLAWWQTGFVASRLYREQSSRFMPPLEVGALPTSLVERFLWTSGGNALIRTAGFLAPLTTQSVGDGACFVRVD